MIEAEEYTRAELARKAGYRPLSPESRMRDLERISDVHEHLAALVSPTKQLSDGQPAAREVRQVPLRILPLDELNRSFSELFQWVEFWRTTLGRSEWPAPRGMVHLDDNGDPIGPRLLTTKDGGMETVRRWSLALVARLKVWWPDIVKHPAWPSFEEECLHPFVSRVVQSWPLEARAPVPQKPRECLDCGSRDVIASVYHVETALCWSCNAVYRLEKWVPIKEAAADIGKTVRTVENWISRPKPPLIALPVEHHLGKRHVELNMLRSYAALMLLLAPRAKPGSTAISQL
ncbi:hypothetical protein C5E10_06280 [Pseudoclavibacter sp. RFBG4]|uniref:hypothetical protein n=1 Tax=Pseudoclavibacter sp. RFBG4 TaxID=2080575 RepID=UPI000CE85EDE|nr:hypothetical protein [Pseudoclavibacter sp. RFBG4]PPG35195.1 hypothetical protein C5E10_06280 [Pseudoclavibacter sp. RFBG4]